MLIDDIIIGSDISESAWVVCLIVPSASNCTDLSEFCFLLEIPYICMGKYHILLNLLQKY